MQLLLSIAIFTLLSTAELYSFSLRKILHSGSSLANRNVYERFELNSFLKSMLIEMFHARLGPRIQYARK